MAAVRSDSLEYFPENILIDILSYLSVQELVRNSRVCRRWQQLVKDQRLWRCVDLSSLKRVSSRLLWLLLRQYLGVGLRYLRVRGLLLSARGGSFLTHSWLKALCGRCPRLRTLSLLHADLRALQSCRVLPPLLHTLELHSCEVPPGFFSADTGTDTQITQISIQTLVLNSVPSFSDQHLRSVCVWPQLRRLELRDLLRVTVAGLKSCVPPDTHTRQTSAAPPGTHTLRALTHLELQTGVRAQMLALGLAEGWPGLQRLSLGGTEVNLGLLALGRLRELRWLRLHSCRLTHNMLLRSFRCVPQLRVLEFSEVEFVEDEINTQQTREAEPEAALKHALHTLLPSCTLHFTHCTHTVKTD
ncbi:F-box/LRR-repeat protein 12-like [Danio aesculapii]|uniref:F-box/LRR-repeat protein 12-like n=1 Tax=Danio aesculapii TaxID=1142201 RepID=UPI0024C027E4|nr:F-box/LRR-repeat protein 12-like [Danio aesculapii]